MHAIKISKFMHSIKPRTESIDNSKTIPWPEKLEHLDGLYIHIASLDGMTQLSGIVSRVYTADKVLYIGDSGGFRIDTEKFNLKFVNNRQEYSHLSVLLNKLEVATLVALLRDRTATVDDQRILDIKEHFIESIEREHGKGFEELYVFKDKDNKLHVGTLLDDAFNTVAGQIKTKHFMLNTADDPLCIMQKE